MKIATLILVALLTVSIAHAQSGIEPKPFGKVILDNEKVKVTAIESEPGKDMCGIGKHSHGPHLTVLLTEATVTVTLPNGKVSTTKSAAGTTFWSEAETHVVINSGKNIVKAQIIEYKKKP
ncbi:MAG: hypothetical protein JNL40_15675 [Cyclobacteriaceae bacterium]|nr:hypothetical protein [Cyclobacteriaceae bacterium]